MCYDNYKERHYLGFRNAPLTIAHMINNNVGMMIFASAYANEEVGTKLPDMVTGFQRMFVILLLILVLGGISAIITRKTDKIVVYIVSLMGILSLTFFWDYCE